MAANTRPPRSTDATEDDSVIEGDAPKTPRGKKHWLLIELSAEQSVGVREMARVAGGKSQDFYKSLISPVIDQALKDFEENREVVAARARAKAAQVALEKAQELARKAAEAAAEAEATANAKANGKAS